MAIIFSKFASLHYNCIKIDSSFTESDQTDSQITMDDVSEDIPPEDKFTAQQQTLMLNEDKCLHIPPGEKRLR